MINTRAIHVDVNSNLLIIGRASSFFGLREINYATKYDDVLEHYGEDSPLMEAYKTAYNEGVKDIFLLNVHQKSDYFEIIDLIKQNDFSYIVFSDLFLSDTFQDSLHMHLTHSFFAYLLGSMGRDTESVFVVTDKHASLFEDIDSFMNHMDYEVRLFKKRCAPIANLENIIVVANNLKQTTQASVLLASKLCTTSARDYPSGFSGEAIYHINKYDRPGNYAYFKNHPDGKVTIENLINCLPGGPEKIVSISRILKFIKRTLNLDNFKGSLFNAYVKVQIEKQIDEYLSKLKGDLIHSYKISDTQAFRGTFGVVDVVCKYEVLPINCIEKCSLEKRIEVD